MFLLLFIPIPRGLSPFIYGIIEKNTKMSTLELVEEDLEGLNLQGMFKSLLIIHKQNTKEIIAVKEPLYAGPSLER